MKKDRLGDRMKGYENVSKTRLMSRTPVIIRIDGKAFHTWTRQLPAYDPGLADDPFSDVMNRAMAETTKKLVANMQNAVLGYTQSDEISILLNDWKTFETDSWFGNSVQKIASVSASMATAYFNNLVSEQGNFNFSSAMFDARVFNVPKEEVVNYFVWRQQDASRNSVQMLGRHYFSHGQLHKKNAGRIQDMLMEHHSINWNDIDTWKKRGTGVKRVPITENVLWRTEDGPPTRLEIDREIPIFTQDRDYINGLLEGEE